MNKILHIIVVLLIYHLMKSLMVFYLIVQNQRIISLD
ncbi:hypothetical protein Prede_2552 [Prevotella dentalis DSM 3688]|uniref:Uncharacterized protein n=1 Tax=Prevotella dentalis (strain ATCC 49559 / DSM 3688 / JCM 13448 / NCTC 12043 / ES 2772) TaxID=908937 RepID=L0JHK2_PREDD|nr:hypothetical protein Prede_2552 [Prevotella dentalis DSM 3688]